MKNKWSHFLNGVISERVHDLVLSRIILKNLHVFVYVKGSKQCSVMDLDHRIK